MRPRSTSESIDPATASSRAIFGSKRTVPKNSWGLAVPFLALALVACEAPATYPLRLGTNVWTGYEPLYLARDDGLVEPRDIRFVELLSATQVIGALRAGALEAAAITLDEALQIAERGPPIRIVAVLDESHGADALVARPDITSLAGLRGKKIAAENSALGAWMLSRALDAGGLRLEDVEVVPVEIDHHAETYAHGQVDAVVTFDPALQLLLASGARVLFDSSMIPGEIVDVLVVRLDVLEDPRRRVALRKMLGAWDVELAAVAHDPARAAARMRRLHSDPTLTVKSLEAIKLTTTSDSRRLLTGDAAPLAATASRLAKLAHERGLLLREIDVRGLFDLRLLSPVPEEVAR